MGDILEGVTFLQAAAELGKSCLPRISRYGAVMPEKAHVGRQLKAARKARDLTLREAAERLSITHVSLSAIERGVAGASVDRLAEIAEAYGCGLDIQLIDHRDPHSDLIWRISRVMPLLSPDQKETLEALVGMYEKQVKAPK